MNDINEMCDKILDTYEKNNIPLFKDSNNTDNNDPSSKLEKLCLSLTLLIESKKIPNNDELSSLINKSLEYIYTNKNDTKYCTIKNNNNNTLYKDLNDEQITTFENKCSSFINHINELSNNIYEKSIEYYSKQNPIILTNINNDTNNNDTNNNNDNNNDTNNDTNNNDTNNNDTNNNDTNNEKIVKDKYKNNNGTNIMSLLIKKQNEEIKELL